MKILGRIGGSFALLYLVCSVFVVAAIEPSAVGVVAQAHAETVKVAEVIKPDVEAKAEATAEQSVVADTADKIPDWLSILSTVIALASAIAAVTPSPKDNAVLIVLRKAVDIFALNFLGAKNASAVDAERNAKSKLSGR